MEVNGIGLLKSIMLQLLHALKEIHSQGIVHRDVKLANILIRERVKKSTGYEQYGTEGSYSDARKFESISDFHFFTKIANLQVDVRL